MELRLVPSIMNVHTGGDLQAAINKAQPGDQIVLDAGATFSGTITLPNKAGSQWITIQSSALASLPAPGQRVGPQDAAFMPKITAPAYAPALQTSPGAHNFRFVGIEFLPATKDTFVYDLIDLGDGSGAQTSLSQVPHDLTLDQCYVHTWLDQPLKRGVALNSAATTIVNSYIAGFKVDGQDSQAVGGWNGPGPFTIDNNYLEAAGENIMFGGATASIPGLVPSDIEIRNNLVTKPLSWDPNAKAAYTGHHWTVKNLLELKNAQRVTIDGNRFENNWLDAQVGFAILFTPRSDPWSVVQNVNFTNNVVAHTAQGINILGTDDIHHSAVTQNIRIQNNLLDDIGSSLWGAGDGRVFQLLVGLDGGSKGVVIDHNTVTSAHTLVIVDPSHTGFVFTNNIAANGLYGMLVDGLGEGPAALQKAFPDGVIQGNVIVGGNSQNYPAGNFFPSDWQSVGFVNFAGGDYHLAASSPYKGKGTNGTNPGADMSALLADQAPSPVSPVSASSLAVAGLPSSVVAGAAGNFTVTATDTSGKTFPGYRGTVHFSSSDSQAVLPADYTFTAADNGVHTFSVTLKSAGTRSLTATDTTTFGISGSQTAITVNPSAASGLRVGGFSSPVTAGISASFTVTAIDSFGNTATGYRGTVHFSSSDSQAVLPANYTFAAADNGVHTFSAALQTPGTSSLTATDTATGTITGSQTAISVSAAGANGLRVAGLPTSVTAGTSVSFAVTATSANGNTATSYRGTVHFSSSDSQALVPADYTFTAADNGVHTFSVTLKSAGTRSLTATDTATSSISGSQTAITVSPAAASGLRVAGFPSSVTAGTSASFTVTAVDPYGNTATGYRGTVRFSSDSQAVLPANYTYTAADSGTHNFSATLKTAGTWGLTATDTSAPSITGSQMSLTVNVASASPPTPVASPPPVAPPGSTTPTPLPAGNSPSTPSAGVPSQVPSTSSPPAVSLGTPDARYVGQLYASLLHRQPEPGGLASWTADLNQGVSRTLVALAIEQSLESRTYQVQGLYQQLLHRQVDSTGLNTFVTFLGGGGTLEQAKTMLISSPEYLQVRGGGTQSGFLTALYQDALNRPPDTSGLASFSQALNRGASRLQIAGDIFGSTEYLRNLVANSYEQFLKRPADNAGLNSFVRAMRSGTPGANMVADMLASDEFVSHA